MKTLKLVVIELLVAIIFLICVNNPQPASSHPSENNKAYLPVINKPAIVIVEYRSRSQWENAVSGNISYEDFESDSVGYDALIFPYTTGNGFVLNGQTSAQILVDSTLLNTGHLLHFRDWKTGLTVTFPNNKTVSAFGFDYTTYDNWNVSVNNRVFTLTKNTASFIGVVVEGTFPNQFVLFSNDYVQGGLTVDNISYVIR